MYLGDKLTTTMSPNISLNEITESLLRHIWIRLCSVALFMWFGSEAVDILLFSLFCHLTVPQFISKFLNDYIKTWQLLAKFLL